MLRIAWQTLRARRASLAGAFVAIWLARHARLRDRDADGGRARGARARAASPLPTPSCAPIRRSARPDGPRRRDPGAATGRRHCRPRRRHPRCRTRDRRRLVPGRCAGRPGRRSRSAPGERVRGHGFASAALTPYALRAGHAPAGPRDVVADARLGVRLGDTLRVTAPGGEATVRVSGVAAARPARRPGALFFADGDAARCPARRAASTRSASSPSAGTPVAALRDRLRERSAPASRCSTATTPPMPTRATRAPRPRGDGRDLRHDGRHRRRRRAVRRRRHVRARDRPAPARDRRAARARRDARGRCAG